MAMLIVPQNAQWFYVTFSPLFSYLKQLDSSVYGKNSKILPFIEKELDVLEQTGQITKESAKYAFVQSVYNRERAFMERFYSAEENTLSHNFSIDRLCEYVYDDLKKAVYCLEDEKANELVDIFCEQSQQMRDYFSRHC